MANILFKAIILIVKFSMSKYYAYTIDVSEISR